MSNTLSPQLLAQLFSRQSDDPFLILLTLSHETFATDFRLVNNSVNVVSRGETYLAFPFQITLPIDDGETAREFAIQFDNVSLFILDGIRTATTPIRVNIEMILASIPDAVQFSFGEAEIRTISYNQSTVQANLYLDSFLNTEMTSETYKPTNFPGLF